MGYHAGMTRTTVTIDDEKLAALRQLAAERGVSVSCLVREAVEEKLLRQPLRQPLPRKRRRFSALGTGSSKEGPFGRDLGDVEMEFPSWR